MSQARFPMWFALTAVAFILVGAFIGLWLAQRGMPAAASGLQADLARARIAQVIEAGQAEVAGVVQRYQVWQVVVLDGPQAGQSFQVEYGRRSVAPVEPALQVGDQILVTISPGPGGEPVAQFADYVRTPTLLLLLAAFILLILVVSRWKGLRGLLGMALSLAVIIYFILPQILAGGDPVLVSIIGSFALLATTLYLVYGWSWKTHTAVLGTLVALILTGLLAALFVGLARLSGTGSEETLFLQQFAGRPINLQGLLLGAMIIGALGVLDDLTISQVSAVFELKRARPSLEPRALYQRAMVIGQDHVAATVNTLVLAYVGASLPLLLLFSLSAEPLALAVNRAILAEEVVRTLVGSVGLVAAVPLTTGLAAWVASRASTFPAWTGWLGPGPGAAGEGHSHGH